MIDEPENAKAYANNANKQCEHCGYCPHCGRSNEQPYRALPYYPYTPYTQPYTYPWITFEATSTPYFHLQGRTDSGGQWTQNS